MIKEKTIKIKIVYQNLKYYKNKGYDIKNNDIVDIKVEDVIKTSSNIITAVCECRNEIKIN